MWLCWWHQHLQMVQNNQRWSSCLVRILRFLKFKKAFTTFLNNPTAMNKDRFLDLELKEASIIIFPNIMLDFFGANFDYNVLESKSRNGLHSLTPSSVIQHVLSPSHCPSAPVSLSRVSPGAFLGPPTQCTRMFQGDVVVTPPPHGFLSLHSGFLVSHEADVVRGPRVPSSLEGRPSSPLRKPVGARARPRGTRPRMSSSPKLLSALERDALL